jgi:nucleotide-binding universal stress UspA family protein
VRRIVVCVDGTETSEQVLPLAISWAGALDMSVTILTVVEDAPTPFRPEVERSRFGPPVDAEAYIESLVRKWSRVFPGTDGEIARDPIGPASGIRVYLDRQPAGLLALTTHARSGMQRLRLGAQAASIVRASVAPCLVAPVVV